MHIVWGCVAGACAAGLPDSLVRLSVGLESIQDILADLKQALDGCDDGL